MFEIIHVLSIREEEIANMSEARLGLSLVRLNF